jgi:hypothetical protein
MSHENAELVEGLLAGARDMDKQALLAALPELIAQACDPDIEWVEDPQRADGQVYRGHEGVRQSWERWLEQWDEYAAEFERFIDCGWGRGFRRTSKPHDQVADLAGLGEEWVVAGV